MQSENKIQYSKSVLTNCVIFNTATIALQSEKVLIQRFIGGAVNGALCNDTPPCTTPRHTAMAGADQSGAKLHL